MGEPAAALCPPRCWSSRGLIEAVASRWGQQRNALAILNDGHLEPTSKRHDVLFEDVEGDIAGAFDGCDARLADTDLLRQLSLGQACLLSQRRQRRGNWQLPFDCSYAIRSAGLCQHLLLPPT